jgi:antirestriction protein ArdC
MNDKNFKKLPIQLSDKLIAEIKEGNSLFQKPVKENGMPAFVKPINPVTGKGYSAMNALILGMQRHDDPRWLSADAARYAGNWVKKDEKGTMIEFPKTSDIQAIRTAEGKVIKMMQVLPKPKPWNLINHSVARLSFSMEPS